MALDDFKQARYQSEGIRQRNLRKLCRQVGFSAASSDLTLKVRDGGASFFHQWGMSPQCVPFSSSKASSALKTMGTRVVGATL
jgi:hypothetical protein